MTIRIRPLFVILSLAFLMAACAWGADTPAVAKASAPKTLAAAQDLYKAQEAESSRTYEADLERWSNEYMGELKKYDDWCTREGNSNGGMAVKTAMDRLTKEKEVGVIMVMPEAEGLADIQKKYQAQRKEIEARQNKRMEGVAKDHLARLKDLRKSLELEKKRSEAQKVEEEIRKIGGDSPSTSTNAPSSGVSAPSVPGRPAPAGKARPQKGAGAL